MKPIFLLFLLSNSLLVFSQEVHTSGKAKNVMMGIDLSATVASDTLLVKQHLYALGPVDVFREKSLYSIGKFTPLK